MLKSVRVTHVIVNLPQSEVELKDPAFANNFDKAVGYLSLIYEEWTSMVITIVPKENGRVQ